MAMTNLPKSLCAALIFLLASCSSAPQNVTLSESERQAQENRLGERWAQGIELLIVRRTDAIIEERIRGLAIELGAVLHAQVSLFYPRLNEEAPPVFILPGGRWYFSIVGLKQLRYDNELAAAVSAAIALAQVRSPWVAGAKAPDILEVPRYKEEEWKAANLRMVELLYDAGFDPRGVPHLWKKWSPVWKGRSPDWSTALQEEAYAQISRRIPLLNPIVRTREFSEIEKRLKLL